MVKGYYKIEPQGATVASVPVSPPSYAGSSIHICFSLTFFNLCLVLLITTFTILPKVMKSEQTRSKQPTHAEYAAVNASATSFTLLSILLTSSATTASPVINITKEINFRNTSVTENITVSPNIILAATNHAPVVQTTVQIRKQENNLSITSESKELPTLLLTTVPTQQEPSTNAFVPVTTIGDYTNKYLTNPISMINNGTTNNFTKLEEEIKDYIIFNITNKEYQTEVFKKSIQMRTNSSFKSTEVLKDVMSTTSAKVFGLSTNEMDIVYVNSTSIEATSPESFNLNTSTTTENTTESTKTFKRIENTKITVSTTENTTNNTEVIETSATDIEVTKNVPPFSTTVTNCVKLNITELLQDGETTMSINTTEGTVGNHSSNEGIVEHSSIDTTIRDVLQPTLTTGIEYVLLNKTESLGDDKTTMDINTTDIITESSLISKTTQISLSLETTKYNETEVKKTSPLLETALGFTEINTNPPILDEDYDYPIKVHQLCPTSAPVSEGPAVCKTDLCKTESSYILSKINHSFDDPCSDFYEYACGGVRKNGQMMLEDDFDVVVLQKIKDELNEIKEKTNKPEDHLRTFYDSCMNSENVDLHERIIKGKQLIDSVGVLYSTQANIANFTQFVATLILLNSFPLFDIGLNINKDNPRKLQLMLFYPEENNFILDTKNKKENNCKKVSSQIKAEKIELNSVYDSDYLSCLNNFTEYIEMIGEAVLILKLNLSFTPGWTELIKEAVTEKLLSSSITKNRPLKGNIREAFSENLYQLVTVEQLSNYFPVIDWNLLLNILFNETVNKDTKIQLYSSKYFLSIFEFLKDPQELWKVHNALLANFIYNVYKYFVKVEENCDRENYCLKIMSKLAPDATSDLFMNTFSTEELDDQHLEINKIVDNIRDTLLEEVEIYGINWLGTESSQKVKTKINNFKVLLPEKSMFNVSTWKSNLQCTDDYISNLVHLIRRKQALKFSLVDTDSNSPYVTWLVLSNSFSSKSVYTYELNSLVIPEILLLNYYNKHLPDAINMARIGHVIARGLSHAFDKTGMKFEYEYKQGNMLSMDASFVYGELLNLEENMYAFSLSYEYNNVYYQFLLQSARTLNERVSDITATKLALEALKRKGKSDLEVLPWGDFNKEQLYFVTLAQTFCKRETIKDLFPDLFEKETLPPFLRIRNMFRNSEEFVQLFSCPVGSTMNSPYKTQPFPLLSNDYF